MFCRGVRGCCYYMAGLVLAAPTAISILDIASTPHHVLYSEQFPTGSWSLYSRFLFFKMFQSWATFSSPLLLMLLFQSFYVHLVLLRTKDADLIQDSLEMWASLFSSAHLCRGKSTSAHPRELTLYHSSPLHFWWLTINDKYQLYSQLQQVQDTEKYVPVGR